MVRQHTLTWGIALSIIGVSILVFGSSWNQNDEKYEALDDSVTTFSVYSPDSLLLASISNQKESYIWNNVR